MLLTVDRPAFGKRASCELGRSEYTLDCDMVIIKHNNQGLTRQNRQGRAKEVAGYRGKAVGQDEEGCSLRGQPATYIVFCVIMGLVLNSFVGGTLRGVYQDSHIWELAQGVTVIKPSCEPHYCNLLPHSSLFPSEPKIAGPTGTCYGLWCLLVGTVLVP